MAATKIHAIKKTLSKAIKYIENPAKTDGQLLVSGYNCDPLSASIEFEITSSLAKEIKGNYSKTGGGNNIAYHLIQSFAPTDNVTPTQAHEIGKKLADEFLDGKYEYVIATHIDKGHIHNHIIINSVSFYDYKKLRTQPYKTANKIRAISDRLCTENELSVIKDRGKLSYSYAEYKARKQNTSWKSEIRKKLNFVLETETDYQKFKDKMLALGVEVNDDGEHTKYKLSGQERYSRGNKLSDDDKYIKSGILEQLQLNNGSQQYIKESIKSAAKETNDYDEFKKALKEQFKIKIQVERSGGVTYKIDDINNNKVKERALGQSFSTDSIKKVIRNKSEFIENEADAETDILEEFNNTVKTKAEQFETEIILESSNIDRVTLDGILLNIQLPDEENKYGKVFIGNSSVNLLESGDYAIFLGDKFDYYFVKDNLDPDILESEQLSGSFVKGEYLIRNIEIQNKVEPHSIEISELDIKVLSPKGITLSMPDIGIDSIFIEDKYVTYDKVNGSCTVSLYDNWTYNYRSTKEEEKNTLQNVKGKVLKNTLENRESSLSKSLSKRIVHLEKRIKLQETKELAESLKLIRREEIKDLSGFNERLGELSQRASELRTTIKEQEKKIGQYNDAAKFLVMYNDTLPYKVELESQTFLTRNRYLEKHKDELQAHDISSKSLEALHVNTNVDVNKVMELIKSQQIKVKDMNKELKELNKEIEAVTKSRDIVTDIVKGSEKTNVTKKEKDIEI